MQISEQTKKRIESYGLNEEAFESCYEYFIERWTEIAEMFGITLEQYLYILFREWKVQKEWSEKHNGEHIEFAEPLAVCYGDLYAEQYLQKRDIK